MDSYVHKKEVDLSLLTEGLTLPLGTQVIFGQYMDRFLSRGETKEISLHFLGKIYRAKIINVNFDRNKYPRKDVLQIRYTKNGELAKAMQQAFEKSASYIYSLRQTQIPGINKRIKVPDNCKEYLAIYTTMYEDTYVLEPIYAEDLEELKEHATAQTEYAYESGLNYDNKDESAALLEKPGIMKARKLNKAIGDNLKLLYNYKCQICGENIGEPYGAHPVEAHHIDYFVHSLNNDSSNQLIVCANHHSIIHEVNPEFKRDELLYIYKNGAEQKIAFNKHL